MDLDEVESLSATCDDSTRHMAQVPKSQPANRDVGVAASSRGRTMEHVLRLLRLYFSGSQ